MAEFKPSWAPKAKAPPPTPTEQKLDALADLLKMVASAVASIDTRPVVDTSAFVDAIKQIPQPKVEVQSAAPTTLDVQELRDALTVNVDSPDLSGLGKLLKQTINELPRGGGGGPSTVGVKNVKGKAVNPATDEMLADIKRAVTDFETRMDYDAGGNLMYAGKAPQGTATTGSWVVQKMSYTSGNLTRVQVLTGAWDDRATLNWS